MTPNEIADAARKKIAENPALEAGMRKEWAVVETTIDGFIATSKKKWKVYEAASLHRAARLEMLTAFVAGQSPAECAAAAIHKVSPHV